MPSKTFASKWFLTLFACTLPLDLVFRIWDVFLYESWEFIFGIGLAILELSQGFVFFFFFHSFSDFHQTR